MHLDKKMITILIGCTIAGGIIGGGIGGAIGSFSSHNYEGKESDRRSNQRMMGYDANSYNANYKQMNQGQRMNTLQEQNATTSAQ